MKFERKKRDLIEDKSYRKGIKIFQALSSFPYSVQSLARQSKTFRAREEELWTSNLSVYGTSIAGVILL